MIYNESQYNLVIKENADYIYLYNTYSGAYVKLEKEVYATIIGRDIDAENPCQYFDELKKQGIIKPKDLNEFNKLLLHERCVVYDSDQSSLTFVLVPTLACNLKCVYCFEDGLKSKPSMTEETVIKTVRYVLSRITKKTKNVHFTWFGGEPLMAYDKIKFFYRLFKEDGKTSKLKVSSSIITNGVLLDKEKVKFLAEECDLVQAQITMDGTETIYCKQKGATKEQYLSVIKNIRDCSQYIKVSVRLNCNESNFDDLCAVSQNILEICKINKNLSFYLAKLEDYGCGNGNCLSLSDFGIKNIQFQKYICTITEKKYRADLPHCRKSFCGLFKLKNTVVGPEGELYKCEHFVGRKDKIIGDIENGYYYTDEMMNFLNNLPHEKCCKCKLFPLCLGGCPAQKQDLKLGYSCLVDEPYIKNLLFDYE